MEANEEVVTECESRKKGVKEKNIPQGEIKKAMQVDKRNCEAGQQRWRTYPILDIHLNLIRVAASKNRK